MKIRFGFVSNSSSSSFLLITTEENHQKALKQFPVCFEDFFNSITERGMLGNIVTRTLFTRYGETFDEDCPNLSNVTIPEFGLPEDFPQKPKKSSEEVEYKKVRGCNHDIKDGDVYCPKCGKKSWTKQLVNPRTNEEYKEEVRDYFESLIYQYKEMVQKQEKCIVRKENF